MGDLKKPLGLMIILVAFALIGCSTMALGSWPMETWTVEIMNQLGSGQLLAHCKSKDDDLRDQNIATGNYYTFTFKDSFWQNTLFWCTLTKPNNAHASFEVYWFEARPGQWLYTRCGDHTCVWIAKDDGIYIKNASSNQNELVHPWG